MKEDIWKHIFFDILIFFASLGVFLTTVSSFFTNIWLGIFGIAICVVIKIFSTLWNKKEEKKMIKKEMIELLEEAVEEDMSVELNTNDIKNLLFWLKASKHGNAEIELKCDCTQIKAADKEAQKLIGHLEEIKKSIDSISLRQQNIKAAEH